MTLAQRVKTFSKAYIRYRNIEDAKDLRKENLTLAEYRVVEDMLEKMSDIKGNPIRTFVKGAVDWCKKQGFAVTDIINGWEVSI